MTTGQPSIIEADREVRHGISDERQWASRKRQCLLACVLGRHNLIVGLATTLQCMR